MAMIKTVANRTPGDTELLLPWRAAGMLNARDTRRVDDALAVDPELAAQYAAITGECAEIILLNESLGAPSPRAIQRLFAAIDAEPQQKPHVPSYRPSRITGFFARLSPQTLAWSALISLLLLLAQAGVIGAMLMENGLPVVSGAGDLPATKRGPVALVRFVPDARVADVSAFLQSYQATVVSGAGGGLLWLQFADQTETKQDIADLMARLQNDKRISLVVAAQ